MARRGKPTELENAGRLVRQAAQVIEDRGWKQGTVGTDSAGMCIVGGIRRVANGDTRLLSNFSEKTILAMSAWMITNYGPHDPVYQHPITFNDNKGRTKDEVLAFMRKFADEVDPQR